MEVWPIVLATITGPVAAVLITRWRDKIAEKKSRRLHVFRTLMATRRVAINYDHVTALNLIEVEFYGVESVEHAWRKYIDHLTSNPPGQQLTEAEWKVWTDKRNDLLGMLLSALAKNLGYSIGEIDLKNGGYAPQGWLDKDIQMDRIKEFVIDIADGKKAMPVLVFTPPSTEPAPDGNAGKQKKL